MGLFSKKQIFKVPFAGAEYEHEDDFCKRCTINAARDPKRCPGKCKGYETIKERRERLEKGETLEQIMNEGDQNNGPEFIDAIPTSGSTSHPEWLKGFMWASPYFHAKYIYRIHELNEDHVKIAYTFSDRVNMIQLLQPYPSRVFTVKIDKPENNIAKFFADVKDAHQKHLEKVMHDDGGRGKFGGDRPHFGGGGGYHGGRGGGGGRGGRDRGYGSKMRSRW